MRQESVTERNQTIRLVEYGRREQDLVLRLNQALGDASILSGYVKWMETSICWQLSTLLSMAKTTFLRKALSGKLKKARRKLRFNRRPNLLECTDKNQYRRWVEAEELRLAVRSAIAPEHVSRMQRPPRISLVMPVYNPQQRYLEEAVASVRAQWYPYWELCVADDASPDRKIPELLLSMASQEPRIKVSCREQNGNISAASNTALEAATGDFVALIDHDDVLPPHALYEVARVIEANPCADIIYSDEDRIDEDGLRSDPYFKPDFSESLLLGQNMVSHLGVYRRDLISLIGGFRLGFEGSQDYDLILRAVAATSPGNIHHIPQILYHWRKNANAQTFSETQLDRCTEAARRAIRDYLAAKGDLATVEPCASAPNWSRVKRQLPDPPPLVTAIIPTKDKADLLAKSAGGILERTAYPNLELIIVNNNSEEAATFELLEKLQQDPRVRVLDYPHAFNYSAMNNAAVKVASGQIIALLNNDIEVLEPLWLQEMVSEALRGSVGAVGAKLLYPDGRVQHAGVVLGMGGVAGHSFCLQNGSSAGYRGLAVLKRSVSAVTAACLVVKRSVFSEVGGFDEKNLPVAFNDVDLCLKIMMAGYENIWTPFAVLTHHESVSRGPDDTLEKRTRAAYEIQFLRERWDRFLWSDPFYNPNFSLHGDWGVLHK